MANAWRVLRAPCLPALLAAAAPMTPDDQVVECESAVVRGRVGINRYPDVMYVQAVRWPEGGSTDIFTDMAPDGSFELSIPPSYRDPYDPKFGWDSFPVTLAINGVSSQLRSRWSRPFTVTCGAVITGADIE